ncbi:MAG: Gfo/Idh/MocA family oxidoreductase [Thermotogae bacterium]|nr:Gfo/Idh/MocA family oxidoreductase [Thermotogota bacterium]
MIRVGIVGAGFIGKIHAEALNQTRKGTLHMVYDIDPEAAKSFAQTYKCGIAGSFEKLLESVDVIVLAVPTTYRRNYLERILEQRIPTLCEKPLARTLEEAEWIVSKVKETGTKLMVDHVVRFFPEYAEINERIKSGEIGNVSEARSFRGGPFPGWSQWFKSFRMSGGVILDLAIHEIDYWVWTLGNIREVRAQSLDNSENISKDHCYVILAFENGALVHIEGSWAYPPHAPFKTAVEVVGSKGTLSFESTQIAPLKIFDEEGEKVESPFILNPYARVMESFLDAVEKDLPVAIPAEDGLRAVKISLLAIRSATEKRAVKVREGL